MILTALAVLAVVALAGAIIWFTVSRLRKRNAAIREALSKRAAMEARWASAVSIRDRVHDRWTRFLFPETTEDLENRYFNVPLLADTGEPKTRAFDEALLALDAVFTADPPQHAIDADAERLYTLARTAEKALNDAWDNAERKASKHVVSGNRTLSHSERVSMRRARGLMQRALNAATTAAESAACLERMNDLLDAMGMAVPTELARRTGELASARRPELEAAR